MKQYNLSSPGILNFIDYNCCPLRKYIYYFKYLKIKSSGIIMSKLDKTLYEAI